MKAYFQVVKKCPRFSDSRGIYFTINGWSRLFDVTITAGSEVEYFLKLRSNFNS